MAYQRTSERRVQHRDEPVTPAPDEVSAESTRVLSTDPYAGRRDVAWRATQLVWLLFGTGIALIAIRLLLLLFGANPDAGFTNVIYTVTDPLVRPFQGIFASRNVETGLFEPAALLAIAVYAVLAWVIAKLVAIVAGETRSAVETHGQSVDREYH